MKELKSFFLMYLNFYLVSSYCVKNHKYAYPTNPTMNDFVYLAVLL